MNKNTNIKTKRPKKKRRYSARELAELLNVSESYVKQLRTGGQDTKSPKAQQVMALDEYLEDKSEQLLEATDKILNQ